MEAQPFRAPASAALADLIQALGSRHFGPCLAAYADAAFGGHVCFAYHLQQGRMSALAAGHVPPDPTEVLVPNVWRYTNQGLWQQDACLAQSLSRLDAQGASRFHDPEGRESRRHWPWQIPTPLVDKLVLCQQQGACTLILEFSRWGDCAGFDAAALARSEQAAAELMSLAAAHQRLLLAQLAPMAAFGSAEAVERCLAQTTPLTPRERQVCALHLLGAAGSAIATALGIEAESVKSYRKRAYLRLGVSNERELLLRFLALRAGWRGRCIDLDAAPDPWQMPFLQAAAR